MPIVRGNPGVKAGKVEIFAFNDVDPAWIDCDGRALNVVDEPALFAAIGYTWGGAGAVFNVPNMVDDFVRGAGPGRPVGTREQHQSNNLAQVDWSIENAGVDPANIPDDGSWSGWLNSGEEGGFENFCHRFRLHGRETRPRNVAAKFRIKR